MYSLETGGGYEGLVTFCSIMSMPSLSEPAYYKQVDTVLEALEDEAENNIRVAGQRVRAHILKENAQLSSDAILDMAVSFVSYTSLTGVVFAIVVDSGEVLEYHILSKEYRKSKKEEVPV